ncbi:MAG: RHS repeat-associated core domain-containing protein [Pseudomonadota bacterium]
MRLNESANQGCGECSGTISPLLKGNPTNSATGNKYEAATDVSLPSLGYPLSFRRSYNSRSTVDGPLGFGWTHSYNTALQVVDGDHVAVLRGDGGMTPYARDATNVYRAAYGPSAGITKTFDATVFTGWELNRSDGIRNVFDTSGKLVSIVSKGLTTSLTYDANGRLSTVTDTGSGRTLSLAYTAEGRIDAITGPVTGAVPSGKYVDYDYDANGNLTDVVYADGSGFVYAYADPGDVHNLTQKSDRSGHTLTTWNYDASDRVIASYSRDLGAISFDYVNARQTVITDGYGKQVTQSIIIKDGKALASTVTGDAACTSGCGQTGPVRYAYDDHHRFTEKEYADGRIIRYGNFDSRGNAQTVIEAFGTPEERTLLYTYHPVLNAPRSVTRGSVMGSGDAAIIYDYDDDGNDTPNEAPTQLVHRMIRRGNTRDLSGTVAASEQVTVLSYNAKGQPVLVDGPRDGVADTVEFTYDPATGDLLSVVSAGAFTTTYADYDAAGRPGTITDMNGDVHAYTYDGRGRVLTVTRTADGSRTSFVYNADGEIETVTLPGGATTQFTYDSAYGRLVEMADAAGNRLAYDYDANGNRSDVGAYDAEDSRSYWMRYVYDGPGNPGKLARQINPDDTFTAYAYNAVGKVATVTDPNGKETLVDYDILGRTSHVTQPGSVVTAYSYDAHDNLTSVTDAEGQVTSYVFDDFGRVVEEVSADAGTTRYAFDAAGNMTAKTDALGITTTYTYDALSRLTGIHFPDASQDVIYTYDEGVNGVGHLTGMSDPSGSVVYRYDAQGRLSAEERTIDGLTYTTAYGFDAAGILTSMTYPDGRTVNYIPDAAGRITEVTTTVDGVTTTLASNIGYLPFGPLKQMTLGSGTVVGKTFDEAYRLTHLTAGSHMDRAYGMDAIGNITAITDALDPTRSQSFGYDDLYRLTNATGIYGAIGYTYDKVGGRLTRTENGETDTYAYVTGTHRLDSVSGVSPMQFAYDANGSTTAMGDRSLIYNQNKRLIQVVESAASLGEYVYNGNGQRVKKTANGETTVFHWDQLGNVIGESDTAGNFSAAYVYLGSARVAAIRASGATPTDIAVQVATDEGRTLSGVKVYAFTEAGSYTGKNAVTGPDGTAIFTAADFSDGRYKFRADYLGDQFWSAAAAIPGTYNIPIDIPEEATAVLVTQAGVPVSGVKVYLFSDSGSYLGQYQVTDADGRVTFVLPEGQGYQFRADLLGGRYFSGVVTIAAGQSVPVSVDTGGGMLSFTLQKAAGLPMAGVKTYLFSEAGSYLGISITTDADGKAGYPVSSGSYKIRADYLGYQYWSDAVVVASDTAAALTLPHEDVTVTVAGDNAGDIEARSGVKVYLFTAAGSYQGINATTDENGLTVFSLPASEYKVRADYLGRQFWSETFTQADAAVTIPEGDVDIMVTRLNAPLDGVPVYVFSAAGSYLGLSGASDAGSPISFRLPAGNYNFRADYLGSRYFSGNTTLIADQVNPVTVSTGGGNFTLTVQETDGVPMAGVKCYLFSAAGAYLGHQAATSAAGEAPFDLADGGYKIRVDTLGYQYWSPVFSVPAESALVYDIPHQDVAITVQTDDGSATTPAAGVKTYLFTEAGSYQNVSITTDESGLAIYHLPANAYKIRADYVSQQYWSEATIQEDKTVTIAQGIARVQVSQGASPIENVKVYAFTTTGSYLGLNCTTDASGEAVFTLPEGSYKFRADHQGSQFWATATVTAGVDTPIVLSTGGGIFALTVQTDAGAPLTNVPVYVFSTSGSYLGINAATDENGIVRFDLADGGYMFLADYLGYQHWSNICTVPGMLSDVLSLPHTDVTVTVNEVYGTDSDPLSGVKVYLFTASGAYQSVNATTDADGQVSFTLPNQNYKVRADYLGRQFWSEVFNGASEVAVDIAHGYADIHVTDLGADVQGASVYLFTETGSYLSRMQPTDAAGTVSFIVPAGAYKFRVDHGGSQYWSDVVNVLADEVTPIEMALDLLALDDTLNPHPHRFDGTPPKYRPEPVYLASLLNITGLLANTVVAATPNDAVYYYINDHLGTPQKMIDAQGNVVWEADIKPFGQAAINADTVPNHFRFAGQYFDSESSLHYNYQRYFDPSAGRYLTPDPIGFGGGVNLFVYVKNNPLNLIDSYGLWSIWSGSSGVAAWGPWGGNAGSGFAYDSDRGFGGYTTTGATQGAGGSIGYEAGFYTGSISGETEVFTLGLGFGSVGFVTDYRGNWGIVLGVSKGIPAEATISQNNTIFYPISDSEESTCQQ